MGAMDSLNLPVEYGSKLSSRPPVTKDMANATRHFVITPEGGIREFSTEQAAQVATGVGRLPEFAQRRLHYLQVTVLDEPSDLIRVQTVGACLGFDADGRLAEAGPAMDSDEISHFEHDTCVQWTLRELPAAQFTFH